MIIEKPKALTGKALCIENEIIMITVQARNIDGKGYLMSDFIIDYIEEIAEFYRQPFRLEMLTKYFCGGVEVERTYLDMRPYSIVIKSISDVITLFDHTGSYLQWKK